MVDALGPGPEQEVAVMVDLEKFVAYLQTLLHKQ